MVARAVTIFHHEERGGGTCCPPPSPPPRDPAEDLRCITTTFQYLHTSGWYWGSISASEAREALLQRPEGTFLLRDSSHPQYMLALSVKTRCGPTSVRIEYSGGSFWLDSISPGLPQLQSFPDVLSLIQHYTGSGQTPRGPASKDIHPETKPDPDKHAAKDSGVPLRLMHPLHKPEAFPSLQHLSRLTLNRHTTDCTDLLPLPKTLLRYLQDYPFYI
uniref:cytokine-inducible SH2-containing protein-like n=1 Tax=Semicossyphus pulcher TaxID=241346 RepID=UPI0037E8290D